MEFGSVSELRDRLNVAIDTKVDELKSKGIYITNDDIWNYLTNNKWKYAKGLSLSDMVDDILKFEFE